MELALLYKWINFGLFVGALVYFLRTPLKDFLGDRRETIKSELEELAQKRSQLELRFHQYRKRVDAAGEKIQKLKEELRREGELEKQSLLKKSQEFAQKIREDTKRMGAQELIKAKLVLKQKALLLALDIAKVELQKSINQQDHERLAGWAIQHLERIQYERENPR